MKKELLQYTAKLQDDFSIRRKTNSIVSKKPFHIHSQFEIVYASADELICELDDDSFVIPPGSFLLLNHMDLHRIFSKDGQPCHRYVLFFSPEYLAGFPPDADLLECFICRSTVRPQYLPLSSDEDREKAAAWLSQLLYYQDGEGRTEYGSELSKKLLLAQLLLFINRRYREYHRFSGLPSEDLTVFYSIISYISLHFSEDLNIDRLCQEFFITKPRLYRLFKESGLESPGDYLIRYRIEKAKEFLYQEYPVELAALMAGYRNAAHFCRIFRQRTGFSPKQYQLSRRISSNP